MDKDTTILKVNSISKKFGTRRQIRALDNVSFSLQRGDVVGLLGPNGAGKTTLLKIITNLIYADTGEVLLEGKDVKNFNSIKFNRMVYTVLEGNRNLFWKLTVIENIKFVTNMMWQSFGDQKEKADELLVFFELYDYKSMMVQSLSRGMQQKLCLIIAMLSPAKVVLMDEPTLGLDIQTKASVTKMINEIVKKYPDRSYIICSHDMSFIKKTAKRILILNKGALVADTTFAQILPMFSYNKYHVKIKNKASFGNAFEVIKKKYELSNVSVNNESANFGIYISDPKQFYSFARDLDQIDVELLEYREDLPDYEEMYLKVLGQEGKWF